MGADILWLSRACSTPLRCTCRGRGGVWLGEFERWPGGLLLSVAPWAPLGVCLPLGASGAPCPPASRFWGWGWPSAVARGVWCQAPSLFRLPTSGGGRDIQGPLPVRPERCWWYGGRRNGPTACALASWRCVPQGWRGGAPGGGAVCPCRGCPRSEARPPPAACPQDGLLGSATHLPWAQACGRGGPALSLWLACPAGGCVPREWWGAVLWGMAFQRCEGRLVSGAVPLPAAHPWGRAARTRCPCVPGTGAVGMDSAPAPQRALLRAGVERCGVGGRASRGGVRRALVTAVCVQAPVLPQLPGFRAGCRGPLPTCCGRGRAGVGAQHCLFGWHALRGGCVPWGWWEGIPGGGCLAPL